MKKDYTNFVNLSFNEIIIREFELPTEEVDFLVELSKQDINEREKLILYVDGIFYYFIDIINYIQSIPKINRSQPCKLQLERIE